MVRTVVTRDAEWDDLERDKMHALTEYEAEICACGLHRSVADQDPNMATTIRVCPICAGQDQALRVLHAKDDAIVKALGEKPAPSAPLPTDGRTLGLRFTPPPDELPSS